MSDEIDRYFHYYRSAVLDPRGLGRGFGKSGLDCEGFEMNNQALAIFVIIVGVYSLYLQSQGKLLPVIDSLFNVNLEGASTAGGVGFSLPVNATGMPGSKAGGVAPYAPPLPGSTDPSGNKVTPLPPIEPSQQQSQGWQEIPGPGGTLVWVKK